LARAMIAPGCRWGTDPSHTTTSNISTSFDMLS